MHALNLLNQLHDSAGWALLTPWVPWGIAS